MARGMTSRTAFGAGTYDDANALASAIKQWADRLPFASYGFQVTNSVATSLPAGATTQLTFDTILQDRENWMQSQINPFSAFVVPETGSGVYVLTFNHRLTAAINGADYWFNGSTGSALITTGMTTSYSVTGITLSAGDTIGGNGVLNVLSAGVTTEVFVQMDLLDSLGNIVVSRTAYATAVDAVYGMIPLSFTPYTVLAGDTYSVRVRYQRGSAVGTTTANPVVTGMLAINRVGRVSQAITVAVQINGLAVAIADISSGVYGQTSVIQWLNDGDVIGVALRNAGVTTPSLAADNVATATTPQSPLFSATRISLL